MSVYARSSSAISEAFRFKLVPNVKKHELQPILLCLLYPYTLLSVPNARVTSTLPYVQTTLWCSKCNYLPGGGRPRSLSISFLIKIAAPRGIPSARNPSSVRSGRCLPLILLSLKIFLSLSSRSESWSTDSKWAMTCSVFHALISSRDGNKSGAELDAIETNEKILRTKS